MTIYLSLNSNVGDRSARLEAGIRHLNEANDVSVTDISHFYVAEPPGNEYRPATYSAAVRIETTLDPTAFLAVVEQTEAAVRDGSRRWQPRGFYIDIILWGDLCLETDRLKLPDKDFRRRACVLTPLKEIAPDVVDPVTGTTIAELTERPEVSGRIYRRLAASFYADTSALVPGRLTRESKATREVRPQH